MNQICLMKNAIRDYAWGSRTAIAGLLGQPEPSHRPQAELWMGAHPSAPSQVWFQERWQGLDLLIKQYPAELLGHSAEVRFKGMLPFLFKVLAAEQPLSIQAHPNSAQARAGFERENQLAVPMDAPQRNYKDNQHKPECLCALTPFQGMCGFRSIPEMMTLLAPLWPSEFSSSLTLLTRDGLKAFFEYLMTLDLKPKTRLVQHVVQNKTRLTNHGEVSTWIGRLAENFGSDIGVLSPILLNLVDLAPGQAIFLPPGQLHAYLDGTGIELMANSDNVLRGGLTPKHVDVPELLNVLDFKPHKPETLEGEATGTVERTYPSRTDAFVLSRIDISEGRPYARPDSTDLPEMLLCTEGEARVHWQEESKPLYISKGQSIFVPAVVQEYSLSGKGTFYRAAVNP